MIPLSALLNDLDHKLGNFFPDIDENTQDPTYFIASYFDTKNLSEALRVYRTVRSLTRYIVLLDRFYETGNDKYTKLAEHVRKSLKEILQIEYNAQHLIYSIDYLLEQFSAFWKFEQVMKHRVLQNYTFSYNEIRHFNLSKSSDSSLVYAKVLDAKLPNFNENVGLVLHYNQALLDIQDDWEDIEDDIREDMPNIFVMAATKNVEYDKIKGSRRELVRRVVLDATVPSEGPIIRLVNELHSFSKSVYIPDTFAFLKLLSDRYADTLRRNLGYS